MSHQSLRRLLRLTLVAMFALTLLGTFHTAHGAPTQPKDATTQDYVGVLLSNAWLRYEPSDQSAVIMTVHAGRGFRVSANWNGWCYGYSAEAVGTYGWIPCYHLVYN
jgi:hypothetical protein